MVECKFCGREYEDKCSCIDFRERDADKKRIRQLEDDLRRLTEHGRAIYNTRLMDVMAVLARRNKDRTIEIPFAEMSMARKSRATVSIEEDMDKKVLKVRAI